MCVCTNKYVRLQPNDYLGTLGTYGASRTAYAYGSFTVIVTIVLLWRSIRYYYSITSITSKDKS